jgi:hypothetical protein
MLSHKKDRKKMNYKIDIEYLIINAVQVSAKITITLPTEGVLLVPQFVNPEVKLCDYNLNKEWAQYKYGSGRFGYQTLVAENWDSLQLKIDQFLAETKQLLFKKYVDFSQNQPLNSNETISINN